MCRTRGYSVGSENILYNVNKIIFHFICLKIYININFVLFKNINFYSSKIIIDS